MSWLGWTAIGIMAALLVLEIWLPIHVIGIPLIMERWKEWRKRK